MRRFGVAMAMLSIVLVAASWAMANDREIAREISNKLETEKEAGRLQGFDIHLQIADGNVTLQGSVASRKQQRLVLDATRQVRGVVEVINELEIQPKDIDRDCEIADEIADVLSEHKRSGRLRGFRIKVEVVDGVVTMDGEVANEGQMNLALKSAHSVPGVRNIVNNLSDRSTAERAETPEIPELARQPINQVAAPPIRISDRGDFGNRMAAEGVENALYHSDAKELAKLDDRIGRELMKRLQSAKEEGQLKGFGIGVHVLNGEVVLSGHVASEEQHQTAIDIARYISGVKRVVNDLTIVERSETERLASAPALMNEGIAQTDANDTEIDHAVPTQLDAQSQQIAQELIARLEQQDAMGRLQGCDFDVRVEQAVVMLSGSVALPQQHQLLLDLAHRVPGVRQVSADLQVLSDPTGGVAISPASAQMPVAYSQGHMMNEPMAGIDQTPRPIGAARMAAYAGGAVLAGPMMAANHLRGGGVPAHLPGGGHAAVPARYDHPNLPGHAWPSYAAYPNYAAVTYPKQYSPTAWPYIGPFYPYPQVPLGWRKVTLQWKDGWWQLNFNSK
ncbi:MAG: BON domain-containing protein [Planctomycetaceae bacterium]|nr:MAG: BON domain-containing protein [Planctomycetaceae bacterium]